MQAGYDGLLCDKTRPSRIPPLGSDIAERVIALTRTDPPVEATHWTASMMAKAVGISASSVQSRTGSSSSSSPTIRSSSTSCATWSGFKQGGYYPRCLDNRPSRSRAGISCSRRREEIALLRARGYPMREVARRLGRAASTISQELRRNAATRSGGLEYRATTAQCHAERAARRQSRGSLRSTRHCEPMLLCPAQPCPGKAVDMDGGRIGGGQTPGARSRSPAVSRSTSRTMTPCASAMKPSIKRCSFEDEARCGAS